MQRSGAFLQSLSAAWLAALDCVFLHLSKLRISKNSPGSAQTSSRWSTKSAPWQRCRCWRWRAGDTSRDQSRDGDGDCTSLQVTGTATDASLITAIRLPEEQRQRRRSFRCGQHMVQQVERLEAGHVVLTRAPLPGNTAERWSSQDDPCAAAHARGFRDRRRQSCGCGWWRCLLRGMSR